MLYRQIPLLAFAAASYLAKSVAAETWGTLNTTAVDYETFNNFNIGKDHPFLGPNGIYAVVDDSNLIYVDTMPGGTFAVDHPAEYKAFIAVATALGPKGVNFLSPDAVILEERNVCGQVCAANGSGGVCNTCTCQFYEQLCTGPFACVVIYACQ